MRQSVEALLAAGREAMIDCEHFFDGYKGNRGLARGVLRDVVCHCSTARHVTPIWLSSQRNCRLCLASILVISCRGLPSVSRSCFPCIDEGTTRREGRWWVIRGVHGVARGVMRDLVCHCSTARHVSPIWLTSKWNCRP